MYGLAEWNTAQIASANLVAVPGCYPTASLLALKPLVQAGVLDVDVWPVINAVSGVSGAGRKASLTTHVCEVSLAPYGVLGHRLQPEISSHLGQDVIFTFQTPTQALPEIERVLKLDELVLRYLLVRTSDR